MEDHEWYKHGIRCIFAINRKKDGGSHGGIRHASKRISYDKHSFDEAVKDLEIECDKCEFKPYRIYSSVNPRNFQKASRAFRRKLIDVECESELQQLQIYAGYKNVFFSQLMKLEAADSKLFLIDLDIDDPYDAFEVYEDLIAITKVICTRTTPNGSHIICEPFNPALRPNLEIKKDASILVKWSGI